MAERRTVAALYVDPRGPYPKMPGVDCWDAERNAKNYDGPYPVVAHPPCAPWTVSAALAKSYKGKESWCGPLAIEVVQRYGGVVEQPANSRLFSYWSLPIPGANPDCHGGRTYELNQCDWGHVAKKPTWIYVVGVDRLQVLTELDCRAGKGKPTHYASGGRTKSSRKGGAVPPGMKVCSAQQRRRTPPAFAEFLVSLARASEVPHV